MVKVKRVCSIFLIACLAVTLFPKQIYKAEAAASYNYGEALQKAIMFYEFQRSGKLPSDKRDNWRGDSGLKDGSDAGLDLTGGWYDAGDHVKFNLPMAYSQTMLAWAAYEEEDALKKSGQLSYLKDGIKWVSDYLIKCHPKANVFYYQVGSGSTDHSWWGPAEVMQMERPSYKVDTANPGSCVVGEAAAALASAALVFKDSDPEYAGTCLKHAKELYTFADTTKSDAGYKAADGFYTSFSGFYDELSWAATWLYMATEDETYLNKAESYVDKWGTENQSTNIKFKWAHSWDDVHIGTCLLLAKLTNKPIYKKTIEMHLDYWTTGYEGERIKYTPKGLAWLDTWGSLRYATTTAFLAGVYADWSGCSADKVSVYNKFAKQQVDYALGSTGRSFVVGFGTNPPKHPHHRTAHGSWADSQTTPTEHRHTIYGALVGGPGNDDGYSDDIGNYINNEIACDYNAGFVGALAKMYDDFGGTPVNNLSAVEPVKGDQFFVEAGINASGSNFIEIKALMNNQSGWPAKMGDKLSFKYFIDLSEAVKAGYKLSDFTTNTNYNGGATVSKLLPWDEANNIYYVNVDYTGTKIYPGGQSAYHKEIQFRIAGPLNTNFWDNSNDFSYQDLKGVTSGKAVKTTYIPVYDDGKKVFGEEPGTPADSSTISKTAATFDKYTNNQKDISVDMTLNGNTFKGIKNGSAALVKGTDYTVSENTVTILKTFLAKQPVGTTNLTFDFSAGKDPVLEVTVKDSTPSASITPTEVQFDKNAPADVKVTMTLNGYTLKDIKIGSDPLTEGTDYTITDSTVKISKKYLAGLVLGKASLTFDFSGGLDPVLNVTVKDSSIVSKGNIKVQMFSGNTTASTGGVSPKIKLCNTGTTDVPLSDVKIRYYYTVDGEKSQTYWCDWSSAGTANVKATFAKVNPAKEGADYYLEIGFADAAGTLKAGESVEVQSRFAKADWSNYTQTGDYSFNSENTTYADCEKVTAYIDGKLQWGVEP